MESNRLLFVYYVTTGILLWNNQVKHPCDESMASYLGLWSREAKPLDSSGSDVRVCNLAMLNKPTTTTDKLLGRDYHHPKVVDLTRI